MFGGALGGALQLALYRISLMGFAIRAPTGPRIHLMERLTWRPGYVRYDPWNPSCPADRMNSRIRRRLGQGISSLRGWLGNVRGIPELNSLRYPPRREFIAQPFGQQNFRYIPDASIGSAVDHSLSGLEKR
jgi:hypothetical protein